MTECCREKLSTSRPKALAGPVGENSSRLGFTEGVIPSPGEIVWVCSSSTTVSLLQATDYRVKSRQELLNQVHSQLNRARQGDFVDPKRSKL